MDLLQRTRALDTRSLSIEGWLTHALVCLCLGVHPDMGYAALQLTSAGRPALYANEVEIYSEEHISLYDHSDKTQHLRGRCAVTTHRLFYMDESYAPPTALFLPLEWVTRLTKEAGFLARSGRRRARTNHPSAMALRL
jgi:hypothetical protein